MGVTERGAWALGTLGVFALLTFGVRGLLLRVRAGTWGFVVLRARSTRAERFVVAGTIGAMATIVVAGAFGLAGNTLGGASTVRAGAVAAALAVAGIATLATFYGQLAMGSSWRVGIDPGEHTALVTAGPFRWVRNPIYTAVLVFHAALLVVLPGPIMVAGVVIALLSVEVGVRRVEEPYLRAEHGLAFERWAEHTGRFVPGVGAITADVTT
jgi:protein-S-isoprenylcysteine O-methyltransferase Ste14